MKKEGRQLKKIAREKEKRRNLGIRKGSKKSKIPVIYFQGYKFL